VIGNDSGGLRAAAVCLRLADEIKRRSRITVHRSRFFKQC